MSLLRAFLKVSYYLKALLGLIPHSLKFCVFYCIDINVELSTALQFESICEYLNMSEKRSLFFEAAIVRMSDE